MAAQEQILHQLLQEDQEPFQLKSYIAERRSQMKKNVNANAVHLKKRRPIVPESFQKNRNLCFLSFQNSPELRNSPFLDLLSPAKVPCESHNRAMFLRIPSTTATLLVEAAAKIQKQRRSKAKGQAEDPGIGLFGSFLKRLKNRSRSKKRGLRDSDLRALGEKALHLDAGIEEATRISCPCNNRSASSAAWTGINEEKSLDFEASTSDLCSEWSEDRNGDLAFCEPRFCISPFIFSGLNTPELCSPASSPSRICLKQDHENCEQRNSSKEGGEDEDEDEDEEDEKEQSSPVSILDPPFEDDDGLGSGDAEEDMDDVDLDRSYESVQRAKQQLLHRLRRFEKLAALDPIELEKKLSEGYSDDDESQYGSSEEHEALSNKGKHNSESFVSLDLRVHNIEDNCENMKSGSDVCKETEIGIIEMLIGLDLKRERDEWIKFDEQVDEITGEMQSAICCVLVEELWGELLVTCECT